MQCWQKWIVLFAFMTPIQVDGNWTIIMGVMSGWLKGAVAPVLDEIVLAIILISATVPLLVRASKPNWSREGTIAGSLFDVSWVWIAIRALGAVIGIMIYLNAGPEPIIHAGTGGEAYGLSREILALFLFAGLLMPFLTEFGLMEFFGTMLKRPFSVLFRLPGRSAIDALASWLSASTVGVLITIGQYSNRFYTKRESAVIVSNFSIVSVPFALVVANQLNIGHMFIPFYAAVVAAGLVCALILPRIRPLSRIPDDFRSGGEPHSRDDDETGSLLAQGLRAAAKRARSAPSPLQLGRSAVKNVLDVWIGLVPSVLAVATLGMALANFTPIMGYLSLPLVPILELAGIPEATAAAPAFSIGFLEVFLPALAGASIESEYTRFILGAMSITQLIYMSDIGILIIKSEIPLGFWKLLGIFLIRTVIAFPVIVLIAKYVVYA